MTNKLLPAKQITNRNQVIENAKKDRREGKGRVLAISRRTYRLLNSDVFYVESETSDNTYYFVKFKPDVFEWCSCMDNSTRHVKKCKHLFVIEFAIRMGTLKDIDRLPAEVKRYTPNTTTNQAKSWESDEYDL